MGKVIVITGASSGLGASTAVLAAARGHTVCATMRDTARAGTLNDLAETAGVKLSVDALDVGDSDSVNRCIEAIMARHGRIDTLVNNAGMGFVRSTEQASETEIAEVIDVNLMGVIRTTKAVIPHMRKARSGHVINISSVGGMVGQPFNEIYCATKFAVEGFTEAMACYVEPSFGISFTAIEPGGISSEFANAVMARVQASGGLLDDEYQPVLMRYMARARERTTTAFQTSNEVAAKVVACIESSKPPIRTRTSQWAEDLCALKTAADPDGRLLQQKILDDFL